MSNLPKIRQLTHDELNDLGQELHDGFDRPCSLAEAIGQVAQGNGNPPQSEDDEPCHTVEQIAESGFFAFSDDIAMMLAAIPMPGLINEHVLHAALGAMLVAGYREGLKDGGAILNGETASSVDEALARILEGGDRS